MINYFFFTHNFTKQKKNCTLFIIQINVRDKPFLVGFFGCLFEPAFLTEDKVTFCGNKNVIYFSGYPRQV